MDPTKCSDCCQHEPQSAKTDTEAIALYVGMLRRSVQSLLSQQFNEDEEKHEQQQCLVFNQRRRGRHPQYNDLLKRRLRVIV